MRVSACYGKQCLLFMNFLRCARNPWAFERFPAKIGEGAWLGDAGAEKVF